MSSVEQMNFSTEQSQPTFEVRPGVTFPDWSVISSENARNALNDINQAFGIEKSFASYDPDEDRVRINILRFMAAQGRAPEIKELAELTHISPAEVFERLIELKKKDLVVLDEDLEKIVGAYPLTERETEHLVEIGDQQIHAMCAIDALGAGSMLGKDVTIKSSCRASGSPITIDLKDQGTKIRSVEPETTIVWSGIQVSNGCAADSLCTVLAFFSSDDAFEEWRAKEHPDTPGYRLTVDEGIQVGRAIFDPFLET